MSLTSLMVRAMCRRSDARRDAGLGTPEGVERFDDIPYGPDPKWNRLDVYRPKGADGKLPVIVSVHGGGWVYGDKEIYQYYCMSLALHGFAVVNFSYRLAPRYKFPASLEDTNAVFSWVLAHAEEYGFDAEHVFAVGDSAGAHMLALYSCICTDPAYAKNYPFAPPKGFVPKALALNCGVYEIKPGGKREMNARLMADLLPNRGTAGELALVSPIAHVTAAFPPCLVMTCEGDFLADQAPPFAERLRGLGASAELRYYGDREHVLGHVFHCNVRSADAQRCNADECAWFKGFL